MIRDGTMPSPEEARRLHRERLERQREQRDKQPAEIRKAQAREEESRLLTESFKAERAERQATPFYETFAESFRPRRSGFVEVQLVRDAAPAPARRGAGRDRSARV